MGGGRADASWGTQPNTTIVYKIGIYGWRKRCLYLFLLLLMVTVIVNLALTVWILKVMDFHVHGMGQLHVSDGMVKVDGDAEFIQGLYTSSVKSRSGAALTIESTRNITLNARDKDNKLTNRLVIGKKKISSYAKKFVVQNEEGNLFFADKDKIIIGASMLQVDGSSGATFKGSIQTPLIQTNKQNLRLESPTHNLQVSAPEGVTVQSERGPIYINSSRASIKIESTKQISLEAQSIRLPSLPLSLPQIVDSPFQEVYQLCICSEGGKLFLAPAQGNCQATGSICD